MHHLVFYTILMHYYIILGLNSVACFAVFYTAI